MKKNKCIDCEKELSGVNHKRCRSCHHKYFRGKRHPLYKIFKEKVKCIDCGAELANKKSKRCWKCFHKFFIDNKLPRKKRISSCIDCGKKISIEAKRCPKCFHIHHHEKKFLSWKGIIFTCIDCGIKLKYHTKRCFVCHRKNIIGKNNPNWKDGPSKCLECGKEFHKHFSKPRKCFVCYHKSLRGRNNPHFKERPNCIDCGKKIFNRYAKRCISCNGKYLSGKNSPTWIDGRSKRKYICIDCGKETISGSPRKRCRFCFIKYSIRLCHKKNKCESFLEKLLKKYIPNEYKYVGDAKFWIEKCNPDFINMNGQKKIIEFFGDYWHKNSQKRDRKKIQTYRKYGYDTLVIWEKDLKKPKTINRILEFNKRENKHEHRITK